MHRPQSTTKYLNDYILAMSIYNGLTSQTNQFAGNLTTKGHKMAFMRYVSYNAFINRNKINFTTFLLINRQHRL